MSELTKKSLVLLAACIFVIQICHTVYNKVSWPFCSHNFYYHRSDLVKAVYRISFMDDAGDVSLVDCRHTLPIEGYRCGSIYREVFVENSDPVKKKSFAKFVLQSLNSGGWRAFDERFKPALPKEGRSYIGLQVEKHYLDTRMYSQTGHLPTVKIEQIYSYTV